MTQPATAPDVVVLVPMLGRAHMVKPLVDSLTSTTDRARVVWLCSSDDAATIRVCKGHGECVVLPPKSVGDYATKINVGVDRTVEPLIFFGAIDVEFCDGWLEAAERRISDTVRVVGTNDLANPRVMRGDHATHFLVARDYALRPTIDGKPGPLFTGYVHEFVDDEFLGTAVARGVYVFADDSHVQHNHPQFVDGVEWDASYRAQQQRMRKSLRLFQRRRRMWM